MRWLVEGDQTPRLYVAGYAYRSGSVGGELSLRLAGPSTTVFVPTRRMRSALVNSEFGEESRDHSDAAFEAEIDISLLPTPEGDESFEDSWRIKLSLTDEKGEVSGRFGSRDGWSSPGEGHAVDIGEGRLAIPEWGDKSGLSLKIARRALVAEKVTVAGTVMTATVLCRSGFDPADAWLRRGTDVRSLTLTRVDEQPDRCRVEADLAELVRLDGDDAGARSWYLQLAEPDGQRRYVHWQGHAPRGLRVVSDTDQRVAVRYSPNGLIRIDVHPRRLVVETVDIDPDGLSVTINGECHGLTPDPVAWRLVANRTAVGCSELNLADGQFSVRFGLQAPGAWTTDCLPLPVGGYLLRVVADGGDVDAVVTPSLAESLGDAVMTRVAEVRVEQNPKKQLHLRVRAPMPVDQLGKYNQSRLLSRYRSRQPEPANAAYFESFLGKSANDNTLAVYRELRRRRPDLRLYWGVSDLSVELPDGAEPVLLRSSAWWECMADSRYIVTNAWMSTNFVRHPHQRVLQTWHGTPLKLLGFDRIGTKRGDEYRKKTLREVGMWDLLIAQNPYSAEIFRRAYGFGNEMLEIGYPRNDILSGPSAEATRDRIRERLGLAPGQLAVLYVPTWRENAKGLFRELDFDQLVTEVGPDCTLLVRGHSNTIRSDHAVSGRQVLDVTLYPDVSELYLAADVMITDYSSTMFDYSITGKPMIFFAPDIQQYSGKLRGTYFDLAESAPGPVLATTSEVVSALGDLDRLQSDHAAAYSAWQQRFNPYDDGHAAQRAVDALLR